MELARIHTYHCSMIFFVSIHVATTERDVISPSHSGTGESVHLSSENHSKAHNTKEVTRQIKAVL